MQIFIPYAQPYKTARCFDNRRLAKQILEVIQIISANTKINVGWKIPKYVYNHPNTLLWKNDYVYLMRYLFFMLEEYKKRKNKIHSTVKQYNLLLRYFLILDRYNNYHIHLTPEFCKKHQQILLEKDYNHYSKYFVKDWRAK